ncbi:359_t:CDS:2, partial [Cetraspora pellucida]
VEASETRSSSSDELNNIKDGEISILRPKEVNNIITRLMQAVPEKTTHQPLVYIGNTIRMKRRQRQLQQEAAVGTPKLELFWSPMINRHMNIDDDGMSNTISSDSDSETFRSNFEVETVEDHNIMSLENLNHAIKQLKKEIKHDKYSKVFRLVECSQKRIEASIIVAETAEKGVYHAHELANHVNETILLNLCFNSSPTIFIRTAKNWLKIFGFEYSEVKKEMYMDGHEYVDVVAYHERFLEKIAEFEAHMVVFSAYNRRCWLWLPKGEQPLRKKGQGWSVHISEFLTDIGGRLALRKENKIAFSNLPLEVYVVTYLGKDGDRWWNSDDLVDQVINCAIPIFEARFLGAKALFAFDNATGHCAYAKDALLAKNMNLFFGGKQPKMRNTMYGDNIPQDICFPEDYEDSDLCGKLKGLRQVLSERELWCDEMKLKCKGGCEQELTDCCTRTTMANQLDFRAQHGKIKEMIIFAGHEVIFIQNSIEGLKKTVPQALESVSLTEIRRYAQKSFRYMDVYHKGLTEKPAECVVRKYQSHCRVPDTILNEINTLEFNK